MVLKYKITEDDIVKSFLLKQNISRNLGRKIKLYGKIYINGELSKNWFKLKPGDELVIEYFEPQNQEIISASKGLDIVYEDEYLLVANKPINLSIQPSRKHFDDNLIARLKAYYQNQGINSNFHIVTRLDFSTSGLVLIAKEGYIHHLLSQTAIEKKYLAKVNGVFIDEKGLINIPISRVKTDFIKRTIDERGKAALTEYRHVTSSENFSILELTLKTGRCHQIRVHLSAIGFPIIGDKLYGQASEFLYLHSFYLRFLHPITQEFIELINYPNWINLDEMKKVHNLLK